MERYDTHVRNPFVSENGFLQMDRDDREPVTFASIRDQLPAPIWKGHDAAIDCYWKAWSLAFGNLCAPVEGSGFVSPFIETAFNACLFMWDSAFALMFGRYGARAFDFQQTLNNFYSHQHPDGYICREIRESDGFEKFGRFDPASTGPNVLPWCEWEYFLNTADHERLAKVFPCLLAYSQWFSKYRAWPDGTYWSCGWGCGMDNQPRLPAGHQVAFDHGHMSWVDTTCQQVLANRILVDMAKVLGRQGDVVGLTAEIELLTSHLNRQMWNARLQFYADRFRDGTLSEVKSIASYWALLASVVPSERLDSFIAHLSDEREFNRPHRVPSLSADHPQYDPNGGYWLGGVWAPTTYMVLRGLTHVGRDDLAHEIGVNHLENVVAAFLNQGTLFENYAPERAEGRDRPDFVGWTGLPPIAVLFEYVFGIRPHVATRKLLWDVRLLEEHGVDHYPFGADAVLDLHCAARGSQRDEPVVRAKASTDLELVVKWAGGQATLKLSAGVCAHSPGA